MRFSTGIVDGVVLPKRDMAGVISSSLATSAGNAMQIVQTEVDSAGSIAGQVIQCSGFILNQLAGM